MNRINCRIRIYTEINLKMNCCLYENFMKLISIIKRPIFLEKNFKLFTYSIKQFKTPIQILPWIWHQVSLELSEIDIKSTIESQGCCDRGYNLTDKPVEICVGGSFNVKISPADVINSFVVYHEGTVGMFKGRVSGQNGIVGFDNCSRYLK